jgi:hypothetical protein
MKKHYPGIYMRAINHSKSLLGVWIALFIAFTVLAGCSNPLNYEVASLTDQRRAKVQQILTASQSTRLDNWMARKSEGGMKIPPGVTVQQAIKDQDDWLAKRKIEAAKADELKKRAQAERAAEQAVLERVLSATVLSKRNGVQPDDRQVVVLGIRYDNGGDKDIRGLKGVFKFTDIYGNAIMDLSWSYNGVITAGKAAIQHDAMVPIDKLVQAQAMLWGTDFDKLKSTFEVNNIVFKDGTSITARH